MSNQPDLTIINSREDKPESSGLNVQIAEDNLKKQVKDAIRIFSQFQEELENKEDLREGLSYLDMKNDVLLSYLIDLCNLVLRKARGQKINGHQSIDRMIEGRVILEKLAGIDIRLKYQINKIITQPEDEEETVEERVNIDNFDLDIDDDDEEEDDDYDDKNQDSDASDLNDDDGNDDDDDVVKRKQIKKSSSQNKTCKQVVAPYKPPKLRAVVYKEQKEQDQDKEQRDRERDKRVINFEEENYTRLRASKRKNSVSKSNKGKKRSYRARK